MAILKALTGQTGTVPRRNHWWMVGVFSVAQVWLYFFSRTPDLGAYRPTVVWGTGVLALTYF